VLSLVYSLYEEQQDSEVTCTPRCLSSSPENSLLSRIYRSVNFRKPDDSEDTSKYITLKCLNEKSVLVKTYISLTLNISN